MGGLNMATRCWLSYTIWSSEESKKDGRGSRLNIGDEALINGQRVSASVSAPVSVYLEVDDAASYYFPVDGGVKAYCNA